MTQPVEWKLNIVLPMAGLGSRFRQAGFEVLKPLIDVRGRPMYAWATESLPLGKCTRLIFILLASSPGCEALHADIDARYLRYQPIVLMVPELTAGQAVTVARAQGYINNDEPLLIHNADTAFDVDPSWVEQVHRDGLDGALLVFRSSEARWSFARADADGYVAEVREKQVISPWATTGTYWFRRGRDFVGAVEARLHADRRDANEFYVGPLYNDLIAAGARVKTVAIRKLYCFGTPEDLTSTLRDLP